MKIFTMMKTISKNVAGGPATLMYPAKPMHYPQITRGRIENDIERCIFCGQCGRRCPTAAIVVAKEQREWQIDRLKCCTCNLCVEICPVKCLLTVNQYPPPVTTREMALHQVSAPPVAETKPRGDL